MYTATSHIVNEKHVVISRSVQLVMVLLALALLQSCGEPITVPDEVKEAIREYADQECQMRYSVNGCDAMSISVDVVWEMTPGVYAEFWCICGIDATVTIEGQIYSLSDSPDYYGYCEIVRRTTGIYGNCYALGYSPCIDVCLSEDD